MSANISANFKKKFEIALMVSGVSGAGENGFMKKQKQKIS
jgi:hypothetical protein